MSIQPIRKVVIVGGGSAGWMAAAGLAKLMGPLLQIELVESDQISTVGVGEATIPNLKVFNAVLGLDEDAFLAATQGAIKLGVRFQNWRRLGHSYIHAFGEIGVNLGRVPFHHYWLRARGAPAAGDLWDYSLAAQAAARGRFGRTAQTGESVAHAYHFDASLYAKHLRAYAEARGVKRTEGKIVKVSQNAETGFVESLTLESGAVVAGELFVDCSGFRAVLIGDTLKTPYIDWSHWLPVDRAFATQVTNIAPPHPYTAAIAHKAGWQWRIPLQHRTGTGHVFCSAQMSEDEAASILLNNLGGEKLRDPWLIKFKTGRREKFWNKNVVSIGLSSGFLEPLESTSIHLIQSGVSRLISLFPDASFAQADIDEYNRQQGLEFDRIRDFIILHYHANERTDTPFWIQCREMSIPDVLARKIALFRSGGRIYRDNEDLFAEISWLQVLIGQGVDPVGYHPMADQVSGADLAEFLANIRKRVTAQAETLPAHADFLAATCPAPPPA